MEAGADATGRLTAPTAVTRRGVIVAWLVCALALGACGSDDGPDGAREAVERYVAALESGDGEAACEQLSAGAVAEIEGQTGGRPCADALGMLLSALGGQGEELQGLEVTEVNVAGDVATATIDGPRGEVVSELELQDGEWKLASPGGR